MHARASRTAIRVACIAVALAVLTACSGDPKDTTAPSRGPAGTASTPGAGMSVSRGIDLDGAEAYGLAVGEDAVWAISFQAGSLSRIDPSTDTVTRSVRFDSGVAVALSDVSGLWVAGYGAGSSSLYRVDQASGDPVAQVELGAGELCCDLAAGGGSVWAIDPGGSVLRIDPVRNRVAQRIPVTVDDNAHTNIVYAGDSLWVASDTTPVYRIHPVTGQTQEIDVGGGVPFLVDEGLVWGAAPNQLWALDQDTGEVVRQIPIENSIEVLSLGIGFDSIWVGIRHPGRVGAVLRMSLNSGQLLGELAEISIPARIAIGFDSVWITDSASASVYRISPRMP